MSLAIFLISKDKTLDTRELEKDLPEECNQLFGFETFRKTLWGNPVMETLGCEIIYTLRSDDIFVFDSDVLQLKKRTADNTE